MSAATSGMPAGSLLGQSAATTDAPRETRVPLTGEHPVARVDLMPVEVVQRRELKRLQRLLAGGLVVVVAGLAGGYQVSRADAARAAEELAVEQQRTATLQAEAAQYAQVPAILASVDRAETALATAMATDIEWYRYLSQLGQSAPAGVWFQTVSATAVQPGATGDPLAPADAVADVSVTGRALSYAEVAGWLDSLDGISDLDHVLFSDATLDEESGEEPWVDFTTSAKVLPEAYSDRYVPEGK